MTNWYIENNVVPTLGMSIMLLAGAIQQLEQALKEEGSERIQVLITYSFKIVDFYNYRVENAPRDSIQTRQYLLAGQSMLKSIIIRTLLGVK